MNKEILDFCGECGVLLPPLLIAGMCDNCNKDIMPRENRIQGLFEKHEADKLKRINGQEIE